MLVKNIVVKMIGLYLLFKCVGNFTLLTIQNLKLWQKEVENHKTPY